MTTENPPRRASAAPAQRRSLLDSLPKEVGAAWAAAVVAGLRREGRPIAGGWPGTLVEARSRVVPRLNAELDGRRLTLLSLEELSAVVTATYAKARADWLVAMHGASLRAVQAGLADA